MDLFDLKILSLNLNIGVDTIGPETDVMIEKKPNKWLLSGQNRYRSSNLISSAGVTKSPL